MTSIMQVAQVREKVTKTARLLVLNKVEVRQRGAQPYVAFNRDGTVNYINLPVIPDNPTPEFLDHMEGFLDHEAAHVLFSNNLELHKLNGQAVKDGIPVGTYNSMVNLFEDVRINREMAAKFKGSAYNITNCYRAVIGWVTPMIEKGLANPNPFARKEEVIGAAFVIWTRAIGGDPECKAVMDKYDLWPFYDDIMGAFPKYKERLEALVTCADVGVLAYDFIKATQPPAPKMMSSCSSKDKSEKGEKSDKPSDKTEKESEGKGKGEKDKPEPGDEKEPGESGEDEGDKEGKKDKPKSKPKKEEAEEEAEPEADPEEDGEEEAGADAGGEEEEGDESEDGEGEADKPEADEEGEDEAPKSEAGDGEDEPNEPEEEEGEDAPGAGEGEDEADDEPEAGDGDDEGESDGEEDGEGASGSGDEDEGEGSSGGESGEDDGDGESEGEGTPLDDEMSRIVNGAMKNVKDMDTIMGEVIGVMLPKEFAGMKYVEYTKDFDVIEEAKIDPKVDVDPMEQRVQAVSGAMQKELQRLITARNQSVMIPGFRRGRLNPSALHRLDHGDDRIFRRKQVNNTKDVAVQLVCDLSGSMSGTKVRLAVESAWAFSQVLDRLNITNEIIGFTTLHEPAEITYEEVEKMGDAIGMNPGYIRTEPLYMPVFKDFGERFGLEQKRRLASTFTQVSLRNNVDGASVLEAAKRLIARKEKRKLMIVFSDGQPSAGAGGLAQHLKWVVKEIEKSGVETIGVGIQDRSVAEFYPKHFVVDNLAELPGKVLTYLRQFLTQ